MMTDLFPHRGLRIVARVFMILAAVTLAVVFAIALTGCAGLPVEGSEPPVLPYFVPGTDWQVFTAAPAGEPGLGQDWLMLGLKIVGALTGTSGLLALGSRNGRKAWETVADPQAGTLASLKALGNVATFGAVPPPKET